SAARDAAYAGNTAMQLDHPLAAGALMQAIHVLGYQHLDMRLRFQSRQRFMRRVRPALRDDRPAHHAARPIAPAHEFRAHEVLHHHRLFAFPAARFIPIVRYAGVGADAGAAQDEPSRMSAEKTEKTVAMNSKLLWRPAPSYMFAGPGVAVHRAT